MPVVDPFVNVGTEVGFAFSKESFLQLNPVALQLSFTVLNHLE